MPELGGGERIEVLRLSVVRQYYKTDENKSSTPDPFCEIRVFTFFKNKPTQLQIRIKTNQMWRELERTERLFDSINLAKNELAAKGKEVVQWNNNEQFNTLAAVKKAGHIKVMIDGHELEDVDVDEVMQFFNKLKHRIKFNYLYRYVAFFDNSGNIKAQYDEDAIQNIEAEKASEAFFEENF
jgi:hypothetical protein